LGVLGAQCEAPPAKSEHDDRPSSAVPIEQKKTFCRIQGLCDCLQVAAELPHTRLVCLMDREADFFELFDEQRRRPKVDLLVRAEHDRLTNDERNLFDGTRSSAVKGQLLMAVPRQSARAKNSKQQAHAGHPQRTAKVELRYCEIELPAPKHHPGKPPVTLCVVHVREARPPASTTPLEWFLLTTRKISSVEQAQDCLRCYCLRWRIEDWHRVLKSGCRIESLQHKSAARLKRAIAINLVIAWRIMVLTLLARQCPDLPAAVLSSDPEIEVLQAYAKKTAPASPSCLAMRYAL
jgi:hypothetical protein